jgi:hypothetical protein
MKPEWYVDLRISAAIAPGGQGIAKMAGPGALANSVMGRLLNVVHAVCANQKIAFASAFPLARLGASPHPGNLLRCFLEGREWADSVLEALEANEFLMGYVTLDRPRKVPLGLPTSVSYQLCRVTSRKNLNTVTRQRQIERGNELPFVRIFSSHGDGFSLRFDVVERSDVAALDGHANGYGLSTRARPFFLPAIPVEQAQWTLEARKLQGIAQ